MARVFGVEATACRGRSVYRRCPPCASFAGPGPLGLRSPQKKGPSSFGSTGARGSPGAKREPCWTACMLRSSRAQTPGQRLADLAGVPAADVFLFSSGMAAVYAAWRCVTDGDAPTISVWLSVHRHAEDSAAVWQCLAVFCELRNGRPCSLGVAGERLGGVLRSARPTRCCRCRTCRVSRVGCRERGVPLVVDDTVATFANVDLLPHADLIASSLTKFVSGLGDVMAGSLILNPRSAHYARLRARLAAEFAPSLWCEDAAVLRRNAAGFQQRIMRINRNGEALARLFVRAPRGRPRLLSQVSGPCALRCVAAQRRRLWRVALVSIANSARRRGRI